MLPRKLWVVSNRTALNKCFKNPSFICSFSRANYGNSHVKLDGNSTVFPNSYDPKTVESGRYNIWEKKGYFTPRDDEFAPFSMILPPPNITGTLHLGHALICTVQDVLAKWKKMQGMEVSWIPGIDHAGIATQVVVEKKLYKEKGLSRHDIGRERFIEAVYEWKHDKESIIDEQLKKLGISVDWSRKFFTMDEVRSLAVTEAFIKLYESGLIYRSNTLINWSTAIQSAISDIEVDLLEVNGSTNVSIPGYENPVEFGVLVTFSCKVHGLDEEIRVATTRLETMPGDVAIAVNPHDGRYTHLHGKMAVHPIRNTLIPIICDDFVNPEFGTGAVKITPAHNNNDYAVGKNHKLEIIQAIDDDGKITSSCPQFQGMKRFEARTKIMEDLDRRGSLCGKTNHPMQIPICSRSGDVLELLLKPQWFLSCEKMALHAADLVKEEKLQIHPPAFKNVWLNWLENSRDWCLSRQLWWGHRIPVYECKESGSTECPFWVAAQNKEEAKLKASKKLGVSEDRIDCYQDQDVLDTWFSSALLPLSSLGWPKSTKDLKRLHPLSIMVTGNDILFFWVARMVMLGHTLTGNIPFKKILLTGIICDSEGRKMSKSLGNVVHPEDIIRGVSLQRLHEQALESYRSGYLSSSEMEKSVNGQKALFPKGIPECGVDALRFTLCSHNITSQFINFDVSECLTNRHFCNKIWQASKYVWLVHVKHQRELPFFFKDEEFSSDALGYMEKWILSRLYSALNNILKGLENNDLHLSTAAIKNFIYYEFCDIYLETTKKIFSESNALNVEDRKDSPYESVAKKCSEDTVLATLRLCLGASLRALAPIMPFVAEELYHQFTASIDSTQEVPESIFLTEFPKKETWESWKNHELEENVKLMMEIVLTIRRLLASNGLKKKDSSSCYLQFSSEKDLKNVEPLVGEIQCLSNCKLVTFGIDEVSDSLRTDSVVLGPCTVYLHLSHEIAQARSINACNNPEREKKLMKQLEKLMRTTEALSYKTQVPEHIQRNHALKIIKLQDKIKRLKNSSHSDYSSH